MTMSVSFAFNPDGPPVLKIEIAPRVDTPRGVATTHAYFPKNPTSPVGYAWIFLKNIHLIHIYFHSFLSLKRVYSHVL